MTQIFSEYQKKALAFLTRISQFLTTTVWVFTVFFFLSMAMIFLLPTWVNAKAGHGVFQIEADVDEEIEQLNKEIAAGATRERSVETPNYLDNEHCMKCHGNSNLKPITKRGATLNLLVEDEEFKGTFHENLACVDCHIGAKTFDAPPHNDGKPLELTCNRCHQAVVDEYKKSIHGLKKAKGDKDAPTCANCHGRHNIFPRTDLRSNTNIFNMDKTCGECHSKLKMPAHRPMRQSQPVGQFTDSIHGKALRTSGLNVVATCDSCHGSHTIQPRDHPDSSIAVKNVPKTCGKCHELVENKYNKSVHGQLLLARTQLEAENKPIPENKKGPTCIECHSSHEIYKPETPEFRLSLDAKCGKCHADRLKRYRETFHGKAIVLGRDKVANCSDCHDHHEIYQEDNPKSTIGKQERLATCKKCHPKATEKFTSYIVHSDHTDPESSPALFWTYVAMTGLLMGTFAFFFIHSILWGYRSAVAYIRDKEHFKQMKLLAKQDKEEFVRFQPIDRFLHVLVIFSFLLLVVTGMPLKFYYTDWAKWMFRAMGGQDVGGYLHRVGAVITAFYFFTHIGVVLSRLWRTRNRFKDKTTGKYTVRQFVAEAIGPESPMPRLQDFKDIWAHQKYFLGKGERPQFDKWTYWEKFDYLAVFWGVAMIGMSGLIMWFPEAFTRVLPGWMINIALVIHSDEALLAASFIFTFHFFNVHFRLERFPIDTVIFSGRISRTEMYNERRKQLERWEKENRLDEHRVKDEWAKWKSIAVPFGVISFLVGVVIVVLIYSAILTRFFH